MSLKVETTLGAFVHAEPALHRTLTAALAAKARYHAVKLAKLVFAEIKHFTDERDRLIKELGEEREPTPEEIARGVTGKVTAVVPEHAAEYRARLKELLDVPVTIAWGPLTHAMLEPTDITGDVLVGLGPLFELDPADDPATAEAVA